MAGPARRPRTVDIIIDVDSVPLEQGVTRTMAAMRGLGGMLEGYFAAGAVAAAAKSVIAFAGNLSDLAAEAGVTIEWLQAAGHVAKLSGGSIDGLAGSMVILRQSIAQAAAGSKTDLKNFADLGLTLKSIQDMGLERTFERITEAVQKSGGSGRVINAAIGVLGRGGKKMLPAMMDDFTGGMRDARERGVIAPTEAVLKADFLGDLIDTWMTKLKVSSLNALSKPLLEGVMSPLSSAVGVAKTILPERFGKAGDDALSSVRNWMVQSKGSTGLRGLLGSVINWDPMGYAADFTKQAAIRGKLANIQDPVAPFDPGRSKPGSPDRYTRTGMFLGSTPGLLGAPRNRTESQLDAVNRNLRELRQSVEVNTRVTQENGL